MSTNKRLINGCSLYEYKLCTKAAVAVRKVWVTFEDDSLSDHSTYKWFKKFSSGNLSLIDKGRCGTPKVISNKHLKEIVEANSRTI